MNRLKKLVADFLKRHPGISWLYPVLRSIYRIYAVPMKRRRLHKYGYDTLSALHSLLTNNGVSYYCDAGTLLGIVRDKGFIKHDDDIDIAILPETIDPRSLLRIFLKANYRFIHGFVYKDRLLEFTVMDSRGIPIDVFLHEYDQSDKHFLHEIFIRWFKDRSYPNDRANSGLSYRFVGPESLEVINVHGIETVIPTNAEAMLDSAYGPWRKPDPNFNSEQIKHIELGDFIYRITCEEALKDEVHTNRREHILPHGGEAGEGIGDGLQAGAGAE